MAIDTTTQTETPETRPERRSPRRWFGFTPKGHRAAPTPTRSRGRRGQTASPWWARAFVKGGQPLAVVVVLIMCAPGEHHLAVLAGWNDQLAWGMAVLLAGYAGMAAYLAGEREKGDPGYLTASVGAVVALVLAMVAQPVSHLFVTGWFSAEPRTPVWLVIIVSCVPAPVLGHILHLAATVKGTPVPGLSPEGLLTTEEVAERLNITTSAVRSRVNRGTLHPAVKDEQLGNLFDPSTLSD